MSELWFRFRKEGDKYSGSFSSSDEGVPFRLVVSETWNNLMKVLAREVAATTPGTALLVVRENGKQAFPSVIQEEVVHQFRTDPVTAIRSWTAQSADHREAAGPPPIPVGHPVLARMFGDMVYLSMDRSKGRVESPITGEMDFPSKLSFRDGSGWIPLRKVSPAWCLCSVEDLLVSAQVQKYYLPRPWNPNPNGWISRIDLATLLRKFRSNLQKEVQEL